MTTVLSQLRQALAQRTPGHWTMGASTHNAVALRENPSVRAKLQAWEREKRGYTIAEFEHGNDNWSTCWLMAHAGDLVRLAELASLPAISFYQREEWDQINARLAAPVADEEAWPL